MGPGLAGKPAAATRSFYVGRVSSRLGGRASTIIPVDHVYRGGYPTEPQGVGSMTASDLITAIRLAREVEAEQEVARRRLADTDTRASAPTEVQIREPD